ncbi:(2Fe-2S)-binding protein [Nocardia sp. NPDC051030]|uniref:(2Fe-2S)-binding protein n=1 Tax=Nocardia sp. NPDC051030 TaxID=3155162 RepID=UPI00343104A4
MSSTVIPPDSDPVGRSDRPLSVVIDGTEVQGVHGQTLASVLLANDRPHWRTAPNGTARGVFCGIGICFDCVATVNGVPDIRLCRRPARDGDTVTTQSRVAASADRRAALVASEHQAETMRQRTTDAPSAHEAVSPSERTSEVRG